MMGAARKNAVSLAVGMLLVATLACNISTPQGPVEPAPEAVATATAPPPAEGPTESGNAEGAPEVQASPTPPSSSESGGTPESNTTGGDAGSLVNSDIFGSVSIKNGNETYTGKVTFPGNDTSDDIYVKPVDFDSEKTSGHLVFTLTCSGRGKAKVNYKGGKVSNGSPGCGETWTIDVINGSPDSQITIHLDATGDIDWSLTVTSG